MKNLWKNYTDSVEEFFPDLKYHSPWAKLTGEVELEANILKGGHFIKAREALIYNDKSCIYNTIMYPKTGANLPCFGMDLMCFFEKKVVITFDFQHPTENYLFEHPDIEHECPKDVRFFELGNHFSKHLYVAKCTAAEVDDHLPMFRKYLKVYQDMVYVANPMGEDTSVYSDFDAYMKRLDPVGGYLSSKFGQEVSERFVNDFLFCY